VNAIGVTVTTRSAGRKTGGAAYENVSFGKHIIRKTINSSQNLKKKEKEKEKGGLSIAPKTISANAASASP